MTEDRDYTLVVTVRVYGGGTGQQAAQALLDHNDTFDLPPDGEAEIIEARCFGD